MTIPESTPVIIGAGQDQRPVPDNLDTAFGPSELAGRAVARAFEDAGLTPRAVDVCFAVRLFGDSGPAFPNPFGRPENFPEAAMTAAGGSAARYVYDFVGGQSPQTLVAEAAQILMAGEASLIVITGAEAIANIKAAGRAGAKPDWSSTATAPLEDRGINPPGPMMVHPQALSHGMFAPLTYYALMETARRARLGESKAAYASRMGAIWQDFAAKAASNPYASVRSAPSAAEILTPSPSNFEISSPYTKSMVARDGVNLGAAVLLSTYGAAKALGVSDERMTFLHGHDEATEPPLLERKNLDRAEAMEIVLNSTAAKPDGGAADIYEIYSCFPIVPLEARRILGLADDVPLTLTGGLPFFGGPGNNYSLHGIAEMHAALRGTKKVGVVYANGGLASKHAVGRYGGYAPDRVTNRKSESPKPANAPETNADPSGTILTYTVEYKRGEVTGVLIVAQTEAGQRFYARGDAEQAQGFVSGDPLGAAIETKTKMGTNRVTLIRPA